MDKILRPYQGAANHAFFEAFRAGSSRTLIVMATGLGKTFTAAEMYDAWRKLVGGRAIFVVHQIEIAEQAMEEFREHLPDSVVFGILTGDRAENVTDCDILFTTFQSMHERMRRIFGRDAFSLMVVDEAHHGEAETFKPVIEYFQTKMTVGLTATPNRGDGKDIRAIFGQEIFSYLLPQAIADGWLAQLDYRLESDNIDRARLKELVDRVMGGDRTVSKSDLDSTIFLHERIEAIERRVREVEAEFGRKLKKIIFCRNLAHVRVVRKYFPDAVPYHSELRRDTQRSLLASFKGSQGAEILVRDKFNEGVDVPDAEMLIFLRGTGSETIWLQQLGRGIRKANGKTHVVVLDFVANCDRIRAVSDLARDIGGFVGGEEREQKPRERLHIEGTGWSFNFTEEIRDVLGLLECLQVEPYPTIEEAMAAVQKLQPVPSGRTAYQQVYRQDPRLQVTPERIYPDSWVGWSEFLGETPYATLKEAMAAVQKLNPLPTIHKQYTRVYKQDRRLRSDPDAFYAKRGWVDWKHYLGTTTYPTIEEAMAAVQKLESLPKGSKAYSKVYKQDPRLPSDPNKVYAGRGWIGWPQYLKTEHLPLGRPKGRAGGK